MPGFSFLPKNHIHQKIRNQATSPYSSASPPQLASVHSSPPPHLPEPSSSTRSQPCRPCSANLQPSLRIRPPTQSVSPAASVSRRHAALCAAQSALPYAAAETFSAPSPRSLSDPPQSPSTYASCPARLPAPSTPARSVETAHSVPCSKNYHTQQTVAPSSRS